MTSNILTFVDFGDIKAQVDISKCDGCAFCLDVCPFKALHITTNNDQTFQRHVEVNEKLCKGCGLCQGTCPKEAIFVEGFSFPDLSNQVSKALDQ